MYNFLIVFPFPRVLVLCMLCYFGLMYSREISVHGVVKIFHSVNCKNCSKYVRADYVNMFTPC